VCGGRERIVCALRAVALATLKVVGVMLHGQCTPQASYYTTLCCRIITLSAIGYTLHTFYTVYRLTSIIKDSMQTARSIMDPTMAVLFQRSSFSDIRKVMHKCMHVAAESIAIKPHSKNGPITQRVTSEKTCSAYLGEGGGGW
jgi:hypothetical protein